MSATTLVVPPEALGGEEWRIAGDAYHHLFRVKRLGAGERLRLVDGAGRARVADVLSISKRDALLRIGGEAADNEPALAVELYVAPPKPERAAWLVEKATEVGVAAIRLLDADRGSRRFGGAQLERLRRVAVAAVEQCGRARVPEIAEAGEPGAAIEALRSLGVPVILLDAAGGRPVAPAAAGRCALFVGPEGGWSDEERRRFAPLDPLVWSLGARALRVETAAVVAAGILLATASAA